MRRKVLLKKAAAIVCGERDEQYGGPEDTFEEIARLWSDWLDVSIGAEDVAVLMILMKTARVKTSRYKSSDSWVDIAGYAACGSEIALGASDEQEETAEKGGDRRELAEVIAEREELKEKLKALTEEFSDLSADYAHLQAKIPKEEEQDEEETEVVARIAENPKQKKKRKGRPKDTDSAVVDKAEERYRSRQIDDIGKLKALIEAGWSVGKIAEEFTVTEETVVSTMESLM